ncbi:TrkA family potassium uptake protein [Candidatus Babeliales bacterium]|nr:TrkA family potassium uptake protein [Candidatus Babeliales bacterium]
MKLCVIGLGKFGYELAHSLAEQGNEVIAIDKNEEIVEDIKDDVTQAICSQIDDEDSLHNVGIEEVDTVIVAVGDDFEQSVLITALLKKHFNIPHIIARATNRMHENILKLVGASRVLVLEREMAIKLAHKLSMPIGELVHITQDFATTQLKAPTQFVGKTVKEISNTSKRVSCIAVKKGNEIVLIGPDYIILENDIILFAGSRKALATLMHM